MTDPKYHQTVWRGKHEITVESFKPFTQEDAEKEVNASLRVDETNESRTILRLHYKDEE